MGDIDDFVDDIHDAAYWAGRLEGSMAALSEHGQRFTRDVVENWRALALARLHMNIFPIGPRDFLALCDEWVSMHDKSALASRVLGLVEEKAATTGSSTAIFRDILRMAKEGG